MYTYLVIFSILQSSWTTWSFSEQLAYVTYQSKRGGLERCLSMALGSIPRTGQANWVKITTANALNFSDRKEGSTVSSIICDRWWCTDLPTDPPEALKDPHSSTKPAWPARRLRTRVGAYFINTQLILKINAQSISQRVDWLNLSLTATWQFEAGQLCKLHQSNNQHVVL